jgi:hypothetical protein
MHVESLYRIQMACITSLSSQKLTFIVELGVAHRALLNSRVRVGRRHMVWLRQVIFLLTICFSLLALNSTSTISKIKCVILVCICINFGHFLLQFFLHLFKVDFVF